MSEQLIAIPPKISDYPQFVSTLQEHLQSSLGLRSVMIFSFANNLAYGINAGGEIYSLSPSHSEALQKNGSGTQPLFYTTLDAVFSSDPVEEGGASVICVSLFVHDQLIASLIMCSETKGFTAQEIMYVMHIVESLTLPLYTSWSLHQSESIRAKLHQLNEDYRSLIQVKQSFLEQVEQLLLQYLQLDKLNDSERVELVSLLSYLQSVMMLAGSAVQSSPMKLNSYAGSNYQNAREL